MKRFWISWYSELRSGVPFDCWVSGYDFNDRIIYCAVLNAESEEDAFDLVEESFPDYEERFCDEKPSGWMPGSRFARTLEKED